MKKLKSIIVTKTEAADTFPVSSIYRGEQAFVLAMAEFYELADVELLAGELTSLLVRLKGVELQSDVMWQQWEAQGNGSQGKLPN